MDFNEKLQELRKQRGILLSIGMFLLYDAVCGLKD